MERYDYQEAIKDDIRDYLKNKGVGYVDPYGDERQELEDEMFVADSVTGNASGSYTFSAWTAEENLCHNLDLLKEALESFEGEFEFTSPESNDVTIRCYLLNQCFTEVLEKWNEEHPEPEEDDEDGDEDGDEDAEKDEGEEEA